MWHRSPWQHRAQARGFTFIELMVSMLVLVLIMFMITRFFQQSTSAWDTSDNRARLNLTARAILTHIILEVSQSVYNPNNPRRVNEQDFHPPGPYTFWKLDGTNWLTARDPYHEGGARRIQYSINASRLIRSETVGGVVTNTVLIDADVSSPVVVDSLDMTADPAVPPAYVDIALKLRTREDMTYRLSGTVYQVRAYLNGRNRYSLN